MVYGLVVKKLDIPKVWPVASGTHINEEEADALQAAGFVVMHGVLDNEQVEAQIPLNKPLVDNVN